MIKSISTRVTKRLILVLLGLLIVMLISLSYKLAQTQTETTSAIDSAPITSKASLVHVGSRDSFAITQDGIQAARLVLDFLKTRNPESAKAAIRSYDQIIPRENYGGEYTALQWFCQLLTMSEAQRTEKLSDPFVARFYEFFADNDFSRLKEYLVRKYKMEQLADLTSEAGLNRMAFLEDFILFNNPRREEWEKTSKIIDVLNFKAGQAIADIGSGPGYYTYKFAQIVGSKGKVFAIDTVQDHLNYVQQTSQKLGLLNIEPVNNDPGKTINLSANQQIDAAFMCSLYHVIYAEGREEDRASFVKSIHDGLKPGGKFIIVDNALVPDSELPYHGPYIAKELIIGQLKHYGFRFVAHHAFIPQRYVLVFEKA